MSSSDIGSIAIYFRGIEDPRGGQGKRHKLLDIIALAACGVICGADSWADIELLGKSKYEWLKQIFELPNGIPSHDTFGRVFALIDTKQFTDSFIQWVRAIKELTVGQGWHLPVFPR